MSSKKVFNVKDKVFAKIRGYPAWPAIISGVKADTPSRQRYNVYFYGTGERAECKSEELFPYEENKSKLGKPNKRKYFAEALLQIEEDVEASVLPEHESQEFNTPSNTRTTEPESQPTNEVEKANEIEKINESNSETEDKLINDESKVKKLSSSKKSLGLTISKGTKRKISDVKPEGPSKKSMTKINDKIKVPDSLSFKDIRPIVLVETLKTSLIEKASGQKYETADKNISGDIQTSDISVKNSETLNTTTESVPESSEIVLDNNKTGKSISKTKDSPTSNSEISSNSSNVGHVSRSGRKIKPKKYSDYQNDAEVPKRSRLSKDNSKNSEKQNNGMNESDTSSEQNFKTKNSNSSSETRKVQKNANHAAASVPLISDEISKELEIVNNEIGEDGELPVVLKDLMTDAISNVKTEWKKTGSNKITKVELLHTEVDLLDYIHKLRIALRTDHADYDQALLLLEQISELQLNALMLKKHEEVVETIKKVTKYIGNLSEWGLSEQETIEHTERATKIRRKAETVYNKFISLFTVLEGQTFQEVFQKELEEFYTKTKHMSCDQIYGITSDK